MKLAVVEAESAALAGLVAGQSITSSALVVVEVPRAILRSSPGAESHVEALLARVALLAVDPVLEHARRIGGAALRSLDAIHLASALLVAADLDGFVCYDARLGAAASTLGLRVLAPGNPETPDGV